MRRYPPKRRIKPMRYIKHYLYRVRHYGNLALSLPGRFIERALGKLSYKKSPMYKGKPYKEFLREHGRYGEFQLWRKARRYLGQECKWLSNLYLPKRDGTTCEIDLVALSKRGIFVFESKNYNGWIYGDEKKPYWYQMVRRDIRAIAKKSSFFNPIMQNSMHCRTIVRVLQAEEDKVYSFVAFGNRCKLKKVVFDKQKTTLIKQRWLGRYIKKYKKNALSVNEIEQMYNQLLMYTNTSYLEKAKHVTKIQEKYTNS